MRKNISCQFGKRKPFFDRETIIGGSCSLLHWKSFTVYEVSIALVKQFLQLTKARIISRLLIKKTKKLCRDKKTKKKTKKTHA